MPPSQGAWFSKCSFTFQLHVEILSGFQSNLRINCFSSLQTNLPIFKLKESCVRRRYSDFEWLKNELERDSKIVVPPLPGKALKRQLPFRGDEGIFEESFIEERRQGLEQFINKIAGHPLAQNERCLHMFLQEETIDRNYVPGKVRQ
ncbi:PREDICTED: sorting nexin-12 [Charadrius vociferus]|uniref:sorting nexin-12 n=1 Tax=Charadrius vociferus TaxID=50402 RepID=UPI0005215FA2|nr:PREDICTED: sorting nexin-12 [Charadrius vociferus]